MKKGLAFHSVDIKAFFSRIMKFQKFHEINFLTAQSVEMLNKTRSRFLKEKSTFFLSNQRFD